MIQVLEGNYFQATKQGYVNRGRETIRFTSKINHLPVHSRCNELLRSESHPLDIQSSEKLDQVHCYFKSQETRFSVPKSSLSVQKAIKINGNGVQNQKELMEKGKKEESLDLKIKKFQTSTESIQNPEKGAQNHERTQLKSHINYDSSPQRQKQAAKNPLKQTFSLMSLQQQKSQKSAERYKLNTPKTTFNFNNTKFGNKGNQNTSEDECVTEHAVYESGNQMGKMKHFGEEKILNQLASLMGKVGKVEMKIRRNEEEFERKRMKEQMDQTTETLNRLREENLKLKVAGGGCKMGCRSHQINYFYLFAMFLFGLIFTKAVFC